MIRPLTVLTLRAACLVVLLAGASQCAAQEPPTGTIPEAGITELLQELAEEKTHTSAVKKRRVCKTVIRQGNALVEANPEAPNRYRVLKIVLQSQKRLLTLDNSDRNREALFETCATLSKAPDEYAKLRLEADFILMERDMSRKGADLIERTGALAEMIERYRDTPAEAKSLMMATMIAPKLEAFELEAQINKTMDERFAGDLDVIEWRRSNRDYAHFRLVFKGSFKRLDGTTLTFPIDGMGHTCVMFFWSAQSPEVEAEMLKIQDLQSRHPGKFKVFSFNVDDLADGGASTLKKLRLDWTVMRLPGGRNTQIYRVYAGRDPVAVRVNAHGHALLPSSIVRTAVAEMPMEQNLDELRYHAQLQSLLVGDFLVDDAELANESPRTAKSVPAETLAAIQACFHPAPFRYRITETEALASYQKAERLCREAIASHPDALDLWRVRNCRMIALLGMWNLSIEPKHLEAAVVEAQAALAATPPQGAAVVPRFCLAKNALRQSDATPTQVLEFLINATGGKDAPPSAHAAATILGMDANMRELHEQYRETLLALKPASPALWPVVSFLRDQNHRYRLFKANYYLPPSRARRSVRGALRNNAADLDASAEKHQLLQAEFHPLTGGKLHLPQATDGKFTLLMFVEPPADPSAEFPVEIQGSVTVDDRGRKRETLGVMQQAIQLAEQDASKSTKVIAAFLSDDKDRVQALMEKHQWSCQAVMIPGGLRNPIVRQLGVVSADRTPNMVLLRPDGTVAWSLSGIIHPQHKAEGIGEFLHSVTRGMSANLVQLGMARSLEVLKQGNFQDAVRSFSGPLPADRPANDTWFAPQLHGRAIAYMGLKDWENALTDIDTAILAHERVTNYKKPCPCDHVAKMLRTKAMILDGLGRSDEAKEALKVASAAIKVHDESRSGVYHDELVALTGDKKN